MIAVITGDIIHSRKVNSEIWLPKLKVFFQKNIDTIFSSEIYRGDSFQCEIPVEKALEMALAIKSLIRSTPLIDVRMAIGIGTKNFQGETITQSYGTAFINSGESFDALKTHTLNIKSPFEDFDACFNPILKLVSFISDNWKPVTAETIHLSLLNRTLLQKEIAELLKKDATTVNKALKRGAYEEIIEIIALYNRKIRLCLN